jgi:hypothetical protein
VLDHKMKGLQQTVSDAPIQAEPLTKQQIDIMLDSDKMCTSNAVGLLNRLYFIIGLSTAARIEWHTDAKWSTISKTLQTEGGLKYRTMPVGVDKNHQGGRSFETNCYYLVKNQNCPERCPLHLLDLYLTKRPAACPDRLYLRPLCSTPKATGPWYFKQPIGKNSLSK